MTSDQLAETLAELEPEGDSDRIPPRTLIRLYSPAKPGREPRTRGPVAALYAAREDRDVRTAEVHGVATYSSRRIYRILRWSASTVQRGQTLEDGETGERFAVRGVIDEVQGSRTVEIDCVAEGLV